MIHTIALTSLFGLPLVAYGGIVTYVFFLFTASIAVMNHHGIHVVPFKWHPRIALSSLLLGLLHGIMGLSIFLNF